MTASQYPSQDIYGYRFAPYVINFDQISIVDADGATIFNPGGDLDGYTPEYNPNTDPNASLNVDTLPEFDNRADGQTLAVVDLTQALPGEVPHYGPDGMLDGSTPFGGTATTKIDIDDSSDAYADQTIGVDAIAVGGNGFFINRDTGHNYGDVYVGDPSLGTAGPADAEATIKSNFFADARAQAEVGAALNGNVATATSDAEGPHVRSTAIANSYSGSSETGGAAIAKASAKGTDAGTDSESVGWDGSQYPNDSGAPITAIATTTVGNPIAVSSASAEVAAPVNGSSDTEAFARIGGALPTADLPIPTDLQGIAFIQGFPDAGADDQILTDSDTNLKAAFDQSDSRVLALGELGVGSPDTTTPSLQTTTSTISYSIGFANEQALLSDDFEVGFKPVSITGSDIQEIDFTIKANGSSLLTESFKSVSAAETYFTDHVVDLGLLSSLATESNKVSSTLYGFEDPAISFTNNLDVSASLTLIGTDAQADVDLFFGTVTSPSAGSGPTITLSIPQTLTNSTYVPVQGTVDLINPGGTTIDLYDNGVYADSLTTTNGSYSGDVFTSGDGQHDITAKVGTSVSNDVVVTVDSQPPDLALAPGPIGLNNGEVTLSGTVSDSSGVQEVEVYVDNAYPPMPGIATITGTTWTYTTSVLQPELAHSVDIEAVDKAGNESDIYYNLPLGTGQDGYIVGATIFKDANGNGSFDPGEETTTTGPNGLFLLTDTAGTLVMTGGQDSYTGLPFAGTFEAPSYSVVVSPLTTLIEKVAEAAGDTTVNGTTAAETDVETAFGLGTGFSITGNDSIGALLEPYEDFVSFAEPIVEASSLLYDTETLIDAAGGSSATALTAMAKAIADGGTYSAAGLIAEGGLTGAKAAAVLDMVTRTEDALNQQLDGVDDGRTVVVDITGADIALQKDAVGLLEHAGGNDAAAAATYRTELTQLLATDDATARQNVACYCRGTRIRTPHGDVAVEDLAVGDFVVTAAGVHRPVIWIGTRHIAVERHPDARAVWPVRVSAGAFGDRLPGRDLWMSPGHNVLVGGVLMPVRLLVNGATVVQVPVTSVTYWHVELDSHDVILAEGLPAESYLDTGNRTAFANGGAFIDLHPDFEPRHEAETCAPLCKSGPAVEAARAALLARAADLGYATTAAHDLHLVADGRRIEPIALGSRRFAFAVPAACGSLVLASDTFVPRHVDPASQDGRVLGVSVKRLQVDGQDLDLTGLAPADWHGLEQRPHHVQRWTRGAAGLPAGARLVAVALAGDGRYWQRSADERTARLA